jgi:hypothetical protein
VGLVYDPRELSEITTTRPRVVGVLHIGHGTMSLLSHTGDDATESCW